MENISLEGEEIQLEKSEQINKKKKSKGISGETKETWLRKVVSKNNKSIAQIRFFLLIK